MSTVGTGSSALGLSVARIEAFSDGVFAIAITLLVLGIKLPQIPRELVASQLWPKLLELWPSLLSYILSFVIVGVYWVAHHVMFNYIRRADRTLLWLNLAFLMCISFIPFPAAILGEYGYEQFAVIIYAGSLVFTNSVLILLWWYVTSKHRLVDQELPEQLIKAGMRRTLFAPVIYLIAIGFSFLSVRVSLLILVFVPVLYILPGRIDRHWSGGK